MHVPYLPSIRLFIVVWLQQWPHSCVRCVICKSLAHLLFIFVLFFSQMSRVPRSRWNTRVTAKICLSDRWLTLRMLRGRYLSLLMVCVSVMRDTIISQSGSFLVLRLRESLFHLDCASLAHYVVSLYSRNQLCLSPDHKYLAIISGEGRDVNLYSTSDWLCLRSFSFPGTSSAKLLLTSFNNSNVTLFFSKRTSVRLSLIVSI